MVAFVQSESLEANSFFLVIDDSFKLEIDELNELL